MLDKWTQAFSPSRTVGHVPGRRAWSAITGVGDCAGGTGREPETPNRDSPGNRHGQTQMRSQRLPLPDIWVPTR